MLRTLMSRNPCTFLGSLIAALAVLLPAGAVAAPQTKPTTPPPAAAEAKPAAPKEPTIEDTVKDHTKITGLFTFYRQKKGASDSIYLELPESMLGRWMLLQATASTGIMNTPTGIFQGEPLSDIPFQIRIVDDARVQWITNNFQNRAPDSPEAQRALNREFSDEVIYTMDIKARDRARKVILLDVSSVFKTDVAQIGDSLRSFGFGYGLDVSNSYIDQLKDLPDNFVVRTVHRLNWQGPANFGAPKSVPFAVSYNVSVLPMDGYKPRLGDTRVGYFTTSFLDHSDSENPDPTVNYIYRWRLEKQDPTAKLSPPKKPIVFYIDNAMPKRFRKAATEGLLLWNKAFEKVGIKDAIIVKQMPDDADWDIADVRYNVVRWTVNVPFAIALMRANPLTGEILNASINFDSGFASEGAAYSDTLQDLSEPEQHPQFPLPKHSASLMCEYPEASAQNVGFASEALEALQPMSPGEKERLIYEYIREIACHEMGHCLGLRHNFIASTFLSSKQLGDKATVDREGITASVMDYNAENIEAVTHPGVSYYSGTTGRYDQWAIGYGYMPVDAATPKGELYALRAYASHDNEPGLAYQSDGMADNWDPDVRRFDMSSDPLEWCKQSYALATSLMKTLDARHPKPGESFYEFSKRYNLLRSVGILRPLTYSLTFIGGTEVSSNYKGDPGQKPMVFPVSKAKQKEALDFVCTLVLSESSPGIPPSVAAKLAGNPNSDGNEPPAFARLFPVLDNVSAIQRSALAMLFSSQKLNLIANNEYRSSDTLPLSTLFGEVKSNVWSELGNGHSISVARRNLQRDHLRLLIAIALGKASAPGDATALANAELHELEPSLEAAMKKRTDPMQRAHLLDCLSQVHRALAAQSTAG